MAHRLAQRAGTAVPEINVDDHLVIVGYGVNGQNVHLSLAPLGVPNVLVDLNPHTVRELQAAGEYAVYGNAEQEAVYQQRMAELVSPELRDWLHRS